MIKAPVSDSVLSELATTLTVSCTEFASVSDTGGQVFAHRGIDSSQP
jgi:hypothetical protein